MITYSFNFIILVGIIKLTTNSKLNNHQLYETSNSVRTNSPVGVIADGPQATTQAFYNLMHHTDVGQKAMQAPGNETANSFTTITNK